VIQGSRQDDSEQEVRMLVLSRKPLQSIMIGSDIKITVVRVERNQVRIGIEAPQGVTILREELVQLASDDGGAATAGRPEVEIVMI
jgi:carbon storage regulator